MLAFASVACAEHRLRWHTSEVLIAVRLEEIRAVEAPVSALATIGAYRIGSGNGVFGILLEQREAGSLTLRFYQSLQSGRKIWSCCNRNQPKDLPIHNDLESGILLKLIYLFKPVALIQLIIIRCSPINIKAIIYLSTIAGSQLSSIMSHRIHVEEQKLRAETRKKLQTSIALEPFI